MSVSVIIPLFNGREFIERAVLSVFQQTELPCELIVADDASTDDSLAIVQALLINAPVPVHVIKLEQNSGGPAKPLNTAVRAARGDLVAVLDQDDYYMPEKIESLRRIFSRQPQVRFVFSHGVAPECHQPAYNFVHSELWRCGKPLTDTEDCVFLSSEQAIHLFLTYSNPPYSFSAGMFYREDVLQKGGFDETLKIGSDYEFYCWLALRGGEIAFIAKELYFKGYHNGNLSNHKDCELEDSSVFLKYLWKAKGFAFYSEDALLKAKAWKKWAYYLLGCRARQEFRAPFAMNWEALVYFRFNFIMMRAMIRQMLLWISHNCARIAGQS